MTFTLTLGWWALPTLITVAFWAWAIFWPFRNNECGIMSMMATGLAGIVSMITWIIAAIAK